VHWLWFGSVGDSVEMVASEDGAPPGTPGASLVTTLGRERAGGNDAPYFRLRLNSGGVVDAWLSFADIINGRVVGDTVPYTFRVHSIRSGSSPLRPTGQWATLRLKPGAGRRVSVIPLALVAGVHDRSLWAVYGHAYRVALVADSLYETCELPCTAPDTVRLMPRP